MSTCAPVVPVNKICPFQACCLWPFISWNCRATWHSSPCALRKDSQPFSVDPTKQKHNKFCLTGKKKWQNHHIEDASLSSLSRTEDGRNSMIGANTAYVVKLWACARVGFYNFGCTYDRNKHIITGVYSSKPHSWEQQRDQIMNLIYEVTQQQNELW